MNFNSFMRQLKKWVEQPHMYLVNKERTKEIENACKKLEIIIPDAKITIDENILCDGSVAISVETDELVVKNIQEFISIIQTANNFEIYPLLDGNIRFSIMFKDAMKVIK